MHNQNLGFAPVIPIIVKAVPAVLSFLGGKKKKKLAQRAAAYQAAEQQIASGQAVMATDVMTPADVEFLRRVWPKVQVAANWTDINWQAVGEQGSELSPAAEVAIKHIWPQVHSAAQFSDVVWQYHAVPTDLVASVLPVPELPSYMQPPQKVAQVDTVETIHAGILPGIPTGYLVAGGVGLALLFLLANRR